MAHLPPSDCAAAWYRWALFLSASVDEMIFRRSGPFWMSVAFSTCGTFPAAFPIYKRAAAHHLLFAAHHTPPAVLLPASRPAARSRFCHPLFTACFSLPAFRRWLFAAHCLPWFPFLAACCLLLAPLLAARFRHPPPTFCCHCLPLLFAAHFCECCFPPAVCWPLSPYHTPHA